MDTTWLTELVLFAADAGGNGGNGGGGGGAGPFGGLSMFTLWVPIILLFYFLLIRPQQRQQAKRRQMLAAVKKNDRVLVAGGIYGVVTNVRAEANEATVKVDETTNTKLRVTLGAIIDVVGDEPPDDKALPG